MISNFFPTSFFHSLSDEKEKMAIFIDVKKLWHFQSTVWKSTFIRKLGVNFINGKRLNFSYERMFWQLLQLHVTRKAAEMTLVWKTRVFYIDEIDTRAQFHQHSTYSFYVCRSQKRKTVKLSIFFTLLGSTSAKAVRRTLMKLTLGHVLF